MKKRMMPLIGSMVGVMLLASCGGSSDEEAAIEEGNGEESSNHGGTINYGYSTQPEVLDPHFTTAAATRDISRSIYESLVTLNSNYEVAPMLAEDYEVSEDGKTITFTLREGVLFHNGEEMTSEDVVASMQRWQEVSNVLPEAQYEADGDYTVNVLLDEMNNTALHLLADISQMAAIMPAEIASNAPATGVDEYIGTGPYEFGVWHQDQHVQLTRFEDYVGVDAPADGLSGEKNAYADEILVHFVPDSQTRLSGMQTGEYDAINGVPFDNYEMLEADDSIELMTTPSGMEVLVFNKEQGLFSDPLARQAMNIALDKQPILQAAFNYEDFYSLEPGLMIPDQTDWYTRAGEENYDVNDPDRALSMLEEAGYDGEEIRILTSRDYDFHYNVAVVAHQQLEEMGINATLNVVDWATLLSLRDDPNEYEMFVTSFFVYAVPHQYPFFNPSWAGWTDHPGYEEYFDEIDQAETQEEALALFEELQELFYEDVPVVNIGHYDNVEAVSDRLIDYELLMGPIFWNVQVEE
ncbi:ABC transporter substrate-binding protein [Geomicrobium sediminis]|uniref:Peptide/nickel transport system substrate-binding protein n=1 Tax=Geomicrobium sediminis TaxID=1347788 RepID=A0ABS2PHD9_9BACL|nr:ABC transporter substrate-binding protein [Geomicrobium sediminis]MBM7634751.1 peptide/nickel transport system substrate-binding protein [Geomicrobium sediminis]